MRTVCGIGVLLIVILAAVPGGRAFPQATEESSPWRIGLVTNVGGTISDGGFSESAHKGAQRAAEEFGLDYAYSNSRDEFDYTAQLDTMLGEERNIIVTVGYQMEAVTLDYALQNPDVYFIGVDQAYSDVEELPDNLIGLQFAEDEAAFMVGALAGKMTKSNTVAVIGGMEIPPVIRLAEGFRNGAQYVNPDVDVLIVYTGSFDDGELGTETAQDFIDQGADIIFGAAGSTGYAGIQYAARQGIWVIGVDQDEWRTNFREGRFDGSDKVLTSAIKRVDNGVYQAIASIVAGDVIQGVVVLDTAHCGVGYAPFHETEDAISDDDQLLVELIWRGLAAGILQTGVDTTVPEPLASGEMPEIPEDAPVLSDCEG